MGTSANYLWLLALAIWGCSTTTELRSDIKVPAALGTVQTQLGPNQNTRLSVTVRYLAPPAKVRPGAITYVVWVQSLAEGEAPQNIGALRIGDNRTGSLSTLTPLPMFLIYLTAEDSPVVQTPTGEPLMRTLIKRR
jgi:hypothetical protein